MAVSEAKMAVLSADGCSDGTEMPTQVLQFPEGKNFRSEVTRARQSRSMALYACCFALATGLVTASARPSIEALALGLIVPGGGFLFWAGPGNPMQVLAIGLFAVSLLVFLVAVTIWFATGNVLLPLAVWLVAALCAAVSGVIGWGEAPVNIWPLAAQVVPLGVVSALGLAYGTAFFAGRRGLRRRAQLNAYLRSAEAKIGPAGEAPDPAGDELSREDLQLMRLLLDRALQPVEAFDGFE